MTKKLVSVICALVAAVGMSAGAFAATEQGSFTMAMTGCQIPTSIAADYVKDLDTGYVILHLANAACISNSNQTLLTGIPSQIIPTGYYQAAAVVNNNGVFVPGQLTVFATGTYISLAAWDGTRINLTGFTATGSKGLSSPGIVLVYRSSP